MDKKKFEDYAAFVEKFKKKKKTTDDCYTPPEVMKVIFDYVEKCTGIPQDKYIRPFYPGGDYEHEIYPEGCIVVDNPPFSILTKIVDFYISNNIKFFIFGPTLTINNTMKNKPISCIVVNQAITYTNGAKINTCFITNIPKRPYLVYSEELHNKLAEIFHEKHRQPLIRTIPNFINAIIINTDKITTPIYKDEYEYIYKYNGRDIYGGGFIKKSP